MLTEKVFVADALLATQQGTEDMVDKAIANHLKYAPYRAGGGRRN